MADSIEYLPHFIVVKLHDIIDVKWLMESEPSSHWHLINVNYPLLLQLFLSFPSHFWREPSERTDSLWTQGSPSPSAEHVKGEPQARALQGWWRFPWQIVFLATLEEIWIICCLASISWEAADPGNLWFEHLCRDKMKWLLVVKCVARTTDNQLLSQMTHLELAPQPSDCIQLMKWVAFPGIGWFFLSCAGWKSTSGPGWGRDNRGPACVLSSILHRMERRPRDTNHCVDGTVNEW